MPKDKDRSFIKKVPNILTLIRLALVPVFVFFYKRPDLLLPERYMAMSVFIIAGLTDLLDGYIARKFDAVTDFGKLVDPFADKLMALSALFCFLFSGVVSWVFVTLVLIKELLMIIGGYVMLRHNIVVYSDVFGKIAAFVKATAISITFLPNIAPWNMYLLYLALALTILALFRYGRAAVKKLNDQKHNETQST